MTFNYTGCVVLIVDDEPLIRMWAAEAFEDAGVQCFEAGDADEALRKLGQHADIGLLFTDINMPGSMDGMAFAKAVHEQQPDIELIVTSGKQDYSNSQLPDSGTFIAKPYNSGHLLEVARAKFASRAQRRIARS